MSRLTRRDFLKISGAAATSLLPGCMTQPSAPEKPIGRVIVIGGGFGGATAAKYLRMWSGGAVEVFLIERNAEFISCPTSNLVLGGTRTMGDITRSEDLPYDRLVVSPAVDFMHDQIEGYNPEAQKAILHAWKAGPETVALRQQLEA